MEGNNVLVLNQATVLKALNHYFREVMFQDGQVPLATSISEEKTGSDMNSFRVTTESKPDPD